MADNEVLDETYDRLHRTGPEFVGWLSNHGPMAADALIRLGRSGQVEGWVDQYAQRLEPAPRPRWSISAHEWREPLGDPSRLGDWCELFAQQVHEEPWQDLLARWWPRLLPGRCTHSTRPTRSDTGVGAGAGPTAAGDIAGSRTGGPRRPG